MPRLEQQYPTVRPLIIAVATWCRNRTCGSRRSDLERCAPADVEYIARDLGVSVSDLHELDRMGDQPLLLPRMLAALEIDAAELVRTEPATVRDMQRVCALCDCKPRCRAELRDGDAAVTYEGFCPNALTLKGLQ